MEIAFNVNLFSGQSLEIIAFFVSGAAVAITAIVGVTAYEIASLIFLEDADA